MSILSLVNGRVLEYDRDKNRWKKAGWFKSLKYIITHFRK